MWAGKLTSFGLSSVSQRHVQLVVANTLFIITIVVFTNRFRLLPLNNSTLNLSNRGLIVTVVNGFVFNTLVAINVNLCTPYVAVVCLLNVGPLTTFPVVVYSYTFLYFFSSNGFVRGRTLGSETTLIIIIANSVNMFVTTFVIGSLSIRVLT